MKSANTPRRPVTKTIGGVTPMSTPKPFAYPETPQRPVINEIGGIRYNDAFQWLEEDSEEVKAWQAAQLALTASYLGAGPAAAERVLQGLTPDELVQPPARHGRFWFRGHRPAGGQRVVLEVFDDLAAEPRVLLDPAGLDDAESATLMGWAPSPDGELVAYALQVGGAEVGHIRIVATATGQHLPDVLPHTVRLFSVSWLADQSGFFFCAVHDSDTGTQFTVFRHELGKEAVLEPESLPPHRYPFLVPQVSADGRYAVMIGDPLAYRPLYIKELADDGPWRSFLEPVAVAIAGDFVGDEYIAVTSEGAPRGRIVAIPLATGTQLATWRELVPESDAVLTSAATTGLQGGLQVDGERLVVTDLLDTAPRIRILTLDGREIERVPLPGHGTVSTVAHDGELTFSFSSLIRSPAVFRYADGKVVELEPPELAHDDLTLEFHVLESPDGTRLSYHLLARSDADRTTPQAALVQAYGGWNIPLLPGYSADQIAAAKAGALVVRAHVRGGGEYGQEWWDNGRLENKANTFSDLFAVVDHLIAQRVVDPGRLAFVGGSNGGMLAGVVATHRPELFCAVVGAVPVLDLLRMRKDAITLASARSDYGDPDDPAMAKVLWSYSPYHHVADATAYPATMWLCGENDPRCPAWHGRKMVAALQHANTGDTPQLLSIPSDVGHGSAVKRHLTSMSSQWVSFILHELGLARPEAA